MLLAEKNCVTLQDCCSLVWSILIEFEGFFSPIASLYQERVILGVKNDFSGRANFYTFWSVNESCNGEGICGL
jgi:hypothetical protein